MSFPENLFLCSVSDSRLVSRENLCDGTLPVREFSSSDRISSFPVGSNCCKIVSVFASEQHRSPQWAKRKDTAFKNYLLNCSGAVILVGRLEEKLLFLKDRCRRLDRCWNASGTAPWNPLSSNDSTSRRSIFSKFLLSLPLNWLPPSRSSYKFVKSKRPAGSELLSMLCCRSSTSVLVHGTYGVREKIWAQSKIAKMMAFSTKYYCNSPRLSNEAKVEGKDPPMKLWSNRSVRTEEKFSKTFPGIWESLKRFAERFISVMFGKFCNHEKGWVPEIRLSCSSSDCKCGQKKDSSFLPASFCMAFPAKLIFLKWVLNVISSDIGKLPWSPLCFKSSSTIMLFSSLPSWQSTPYHEQIRSFVNQPSEWIQLELALRRRISLSENSDSFTAPFLRNPLWKFSPMVEK